MLFLLPADTDWYRYREETIPEASLKQGVQFRTVALDALLPQLSSECVTVVENMRSKNRLRPLRVRYVNHAVEVLSLNEPRTYSQELVRAFPPGQAYTYAPEVAKVDTPRWPLRVEQPDRMHQLDRTENAASVGGGGVFPDIIQPSTKEHEGRVVGEFLEIATGTQTFVPFDFLQLLVDQAPLVRRLRVHAFPGNQPGVIPRDQSPQGRRTLWRTPAQPSRGNDAILGIEGSP
jgi:hypothetical protein